jgi:O-antigen ligase
VAVKARRARAGARPAMSEVRRRLARAVDGATPALLVVVLLALLIPIATGSVIGAAAALGLTVLLIVLVTVGIEQTATALLLVAVAMAPMNNVKPVAAISFVTMSDVFFFLGVGLLLPILMTKGFQRQAPFLIGVAGIFVVGLVSSAASADPVASLNGLLRLVVGALLLPIVFMLWRPGQRVLVAFAGAYVLGTAISVAKGRISGVTSTDGRFGGLTEHPNILGLTGMLAVTLVPFLFAALPGAYRWAALAAGAVCAYGIWISGSRAALVGTVVVAVVYLLLSRRVEHALVFFGLSIIPVYVVGQTLASGVVDSSPLGRLQGGGSATLSDVDRQNLARVAWDNFVSHPIIGTGFGDASIAHNIYLQVAAAGGVLALVCYLGILFATARQPLLLGAPYSLLALPAMGYALVGPLTPLLWDRYIWCVLALPFLLDRPGPQEVPSAAGTTPEVRR